jgi:hypothetical protein
LNHGSAHDYQDTNAMHAARLRPRHALPLLPWLILLAALLPAGCSDPETGHVAGKVTLGGRPLTQGSVVFEDSAAGITAGASLQSDGSYTVKTFNRDGLPPGTYKVAVTPSTFGDGETPLAVDPSSQAPSPGSQIPQRYRSTATSPLCVTVKAGDNPPFDFDLTR